MVKQPKIALGCLSALIVLVIYSDAHAAMSTNNVLDTIVQTYQDKAKSWESVLSSYAKTLFWILATIEFGWAAARLAIKGADISEWTAEVVNQIMVLGLFLALMNHSAEWSLAIIDSFRTAASNASAAAGGTTNIAPSDIFAIGLQTAVTIMEGASMLNMAAAIGMLIASLVIIVCFALIAAFMVLALVESYIVIYGGTLMMGFGSLRFTREYTIAFFKYAMSVGAKLLVMQLLVGLGETMIKDWLSHFDNSTNTDLFVFVGCSIVMLALTKMIPELVQGLVNGVSMSAMGAITGAASQIASAAGSVAKAVGGGAVVGGGVAASAGHARRLASEQIQAGDNPPTSRIGRMAAMTGRTMANMGGAVTEDIGRKLSGRAPFGVSSWRMADSLSEKADAMKAKREKGGSGDGGDDKGGDSGGNTIKPAN